MGVFVVSDAFMFTIVNTWKLLKLQIIPAVSNCLIQWVQKVSRQFCVFIAFYTEKKRETSKCNYSLIPSLMNIQVKLCASFRSLPTAHWQKGSASLEVGSKSQIPFEIPIDIWKKKIHLTQALISHVCFILWNNVSVNLGSNFFCSYFIGTEHCQEPPAGNSGNDLIK